MKRIIKKVIMKLIPSFRPQVANEEQRRLGICINFRIPTNEPLVALTFDDGPSEGVNQEYLASIDGTEIYDPQSTRNLLAVLDRHHAKATFFICGEHICAEGAETLKETHAQGHELGVHCWHHGESVHRMAQPELIDELCRTKKLITELTGSVPTCMRPPRGETEAVTTQLIFSHTGMRTILWQETAFDWFPHYAPEQSVACIMQTLAPGSIVLLHDIYRKTPETVDLLLNEMENRGLRSTTISDLIQHSHDISNYMSPPRRD